MRHVDLEPSAGVEGLDRGDDVRSSLSSSHWPPHERQYRWPCSVARQDVELLAAVGAVAVAEDAELLEDVERAVDRRGDRVRVELPAALDRARPRSRGRRSATGPRRARVAAASSAGRARAVGPGSAVHGVPSGRPTRSLWAGDPGALIGRSIGRGDATCLQMRPVATVTLPAIRLHPAPGEDAVIELLANITVPRRIRCPRDRVRPRDPPRHRLGPHRRDHRHHEHDRGRRDGRGRPRGAAPLGQRATSRPRRRRRDAGPRRGSRRGDAGARGHDQPGSRVRPGAARGHPPRARSTPWVTAPSSSRSGSPPCRSARSCPSGWTRSWAGSSG